MRRRSSWRVVAAAKPADVADLGDDPGGDDRPDSLQVAELGGVVGEHDDEPLGHLFGPAVEVDQVGELLLGHVFPGLLDDACPARS